jgi:phytoene synthase
VTADDPLQRGTPAGSLRYFAVLYAPPAARSLLHALYAFEAEVRDTVAATSHDVAHTRLQFWRAEVDRLLGGRPEHPVTRALLPLHGAGVGAGADLALLHETLVAADADLAHLTLDTSAEVDALAFRSAGTIQTLAVVAACLPRPPSPAERDFARGLGIAVARSEWLRDLRGDIAAGRLRLPLATLEDAGIEPGSLLLESLPAGLPPILEREKSALRAMLAALPDRLNRAERATQRQGLVLAALHLRLLEQVDHGRELARTRAELAPWPRFWTAWRTAVRHA